MYNPLDSRQLEIFLELANLKNMGKAGKSLHLTTSAVSHSVKRLEENIGAKLFDRNSRNISLTDIGQRLIPEAEYILQRLSKARSLASSWSDLTQKTIRIGASSSACQYIIPVALREFKESFPGINIQIVSGNSYQLMDSINAKQVDVAIFPSAGINHEQKGVSIGMDELNFVVNPIHPWAKSGKANMSEIERQRFILSESNSYTCDLVGSYFRCRGFAIQPFIEISNEEVIKRLVELDIGIGILPDWITRREVEEGMLTVFPLGARKLSRNWIVAYPNNKELSFAETLFVGISQNVAQSLFSWFSH